MLRFLKSSVIVVFMGIGIAAPALAQDAAEMAVRMQQLEEQVRILMGQVELLTFEVKQLKGQNLSAAEPPAAPAPAPQTTKLAAASATALSGGDADIATIEEQPLRRSTGENQDELPDFNQAPGPKVLGSLDNGAAQPNDGGFQGKVLVAPGQQEVGDDAFLTQGAAGAAGDETIETVALSPETPEVLYEKSNESLLRRQFAEAEAGFSTFLQKYPDHGLAGSAQYWLGETYYAQGDYRRAAQNFLQGYKKYPKGRRAADSLLKLGISLKRLGQAEQACAAYAAVSGEYPKAVEARKRAQAEAKRAGCTS